MFDNKANILLKRELAKRGKSSVRYLKLSVGFYDFFYIRTESENV